MRTTLSIILLTVAFCFCQAQPFRIMSYNVENLFDTVNNPLTSDDSFTPEGEKQWTSYRYWNKLQQISKVIANVGEWQHAAVVGLVEVESDTCLRDLCQRSSLRKYRYKYIHHDSPDVRGIDVALLYDPKQFHLLEEHPIRCDFDFETRPTRDILYAKGVLPDNDTLHIMICHTPSQLGGNEAKRKRQFVINLINSVCDSILQNTPSAQIILMGDFNDNPQHISPHITTLTNLMNQPADSLLYLPDMSVEVSGTYVFQELWSTLDQIFVSQVLVNKSKAYIYNPEWLLDNGKPHRSYQYIKYDKNGYSDHLPVFIDIY